MRIRSACHTSTGYDRRVAANQVLTFGEFRLDAATGRVSRGSTPVALTPKAFALLQFLVSNPDRLIAKQELLKAVWPNVFVSDAVLKSTMREIRRALGDTPQTPRFVETAHRRGYRFIAPVAVAESAVPTSVHVPRVSYAHSGSVNIAYQVIGSGPIDLVFVMGWVSHLECFWSEPSFARFLHRLASMGRLILFDKRGTGLSDAVPVTELPTLEQRLDDVRAVMDAAGSQRAVLVGVSEGGPLCSLFAATYPEKTEALIMIGSYARRMWDADYPWGPTREQRDAFLKAILDEWGGPVGLEERGPSRISDPAFREWWAAYLRMGASPGAAVALTRMNAEIDIRDVLPTIRVPTLVLHRVGDRCLKIEEGRYLASRIIGATLVELDGADHLPFLGDQDAMFAAIEKFLATTRTELPKDLALATVMTMLMPGDGASRAEFTRHFEQLVGSARGRLTSPQSPHGIAVFDGPGRAVRCAATVLAAAGRSGIAVRAGVHVGECDLARGMGAIFDLSAAIAYVAEPGEVLVSRTIVDLVPGSGLEFIERRPLTAHGLTRELPLFAVKT
jgi:pimeloyl-ACP methyl ester carboxylesterase/DNA-binding winged helix-turn-helix (wHTH) protein